MVKKCLPVNPWLKVMRVPTWRTWFPGDIESFEVYTPVRMEDNDCCICAGPDRCGNIRATCLVKEGWSVSIYDHHPIPRTRVVVLNTEFWKKRFFIRCSYLQIKIWKCNQDCILCIDRIISVEIIWVVVWVVFWCYHTWNIIVYLFC